MLQHELVKEIPIGVEDGHDEPAPLKRAEKRHIAFLRGAVPYRHHLFEHHCLA